MNDYNLEQSETIQMVREHLRTILPSERKKLKIRIKDYLQFRKEVNRFLQHHFSQICTQKCYQDHYSACCSREGITTFFADVVINLLMSSGEETDRLLQVLSVPSPSFRCVYLGESGCLWNIKPIVCEMFLCEHARESVFHKDSNALRQWEKLNRREKRYTWPNRPVLFDDLETRFIRAGYSSTLMYFHNSPGLLRVKKLAGKKSK
ncbi:MAG: hypothetical protein HWN69_01585 [Desulfobacterales bacterium]|nr:hypothetical protein [Desulfobacterales bacterium]